MIVLIHFVNQLGLVFTEFSVVFEGLEEHGIKVCIVYTLSFTSTFFNKIEEGANLIILLYI